MSENFLIDEVFPDRFFAKEIHILGAGRFGKIAAKRLRRRFPDSSILVSDESAEKIEEIKRELGVKGTVRETVQAITNIDMPDDLWLVPAVPIHVCFEFVLHELRRSVQVRRLPVPNETDLLVPNPMRSPSGTLYASYADFICPDTCGEPAEVCTRTGRARLGNLFQVLGTMEVGNYTTIVLRSMQLAPGVGGYTAGMLRAVMSRIRATAGKYMVCTSCRCHGVIDALEWGIA